MLTKARKSQIAIEYAYRYQAAHPQGHVFWVYAANAARFDQAYKDIGRKLKLPGIDNPEVDACELVSDWLNEDESGEWLMILDNADNSDLFFPPVDSDAASQVRTTKKPLISYLPQKLSSKRLLLVTTRNRQLGEDLSNGERCLPVLPLAMREARLLLQVKAGSIADGWTGPEPDALLEVLGRIPLAVTQAAAFMRRNKMSQEEYLLMLKKDEQNLKNSLSMELQDHRRERGVPNSVFRTWKLSYDQMREQEPRAAALLSLMAMLDRQAIPETLLRPEDAREVDFFSAVGTLDNFSLITKAIGKETYAIHRLVQLSIHVWLEQHKQRERYEEEALALLAERFPSGGHENKEACETLVAHAQAVLKYYCDSEPSLKRRSTLLYNISWFDLQQGRYDLAYEKISESYCLREKLLGQEDVETLDSLSILGSVLRAQGKYEEVEEIYRRVLKGYEKELGVEHPFTLTSVGNLASVLRNQGKYEAAEEMNRRALEGQEKVIGIEHPDTLTSVSNLALVLQNQGKYEAAEEMHRRALKGSEKVVGMEHPDTLTSVSNLASVLQNQGKYEAAEEMNRRALEGQEKVMGMEHPGTLTSVSNLALVLQNQGKYEAAEEMNRQALKGREKVLGMEHPSTLISVGNLALVLQNQGKYEAAEEMHRRALKGKEKVVGVEHPSTLTSVSNLALVLQNQGKYEAAEEMNRRALEGQEKVMGMEHPDTLTSVYCLAYLLQAKEQYGNASVLYQRAIAGFQRTLGPHHPTTLACSKHYSSLLDKRSGG
jgi:tetratricopeptide (TPR) repeat protein